MTIKSMQERADRERAYAAANRRRALINSLSGGVDSTLSGLVSKLAETESESESGELRALGVNIPISRDPAREADIVDAKRVAAQLGMPLTVVNLTEVWETVAGLLGDAARDLAAQSGAALPPERLQWAVNNLKPTLRMMAAGFLADAFDGLMVGTDNVIENFLGYFSIRGDGIADRQPLRDMTKGEVYRALAEAGFPEDLAYRTPTPGLFDFQNHTDEGELGFLYAEADAFVGWILQEEALRAREAGRLACVFLDETMTLREGWDTVAMSSPCPVPAEVAGKIARQNQKTFFKRKPTDLAWTLRERGLLA